MAKKKSKKLDDSKKIDKKAKKGTDPGK